MNYILGVDVSHWQNDRGPLDWAQVRASDRRYAFVKATQGLQYRDPAYTASVAGATAAGLLVGAYHWLTPDRDPVAQARHFVTVARDAMVAGCLPPVLDVEADPVGRHNPDHALTALQAIHFLSGRRPILYTGAHFWATELQGDRRLAEYPLWLAHYTLAARPRIPSGWLSWTFWQHTSKGTVPGIVGNADENRYAGTIEELEALAEVRRPPPVEPAGVPATTTEVPPVLNRYSPPLEPIVATWEPSGGGCYAVAASGAVYAFGVPFHGGPNGQPYWANRVAVAIEPELGKAYVVVATTGERYAYP